MNRLTAPRSRLTVVALLAAWAMPAWAGPPLVCHRLEIGNAQSLPWGTDTGSWDQPLGDYNLAHLAGDTLALLTPETPVIVRMETMRRAAIYGYRVGDGAKELMLKMSARAHDGETQGKAGAAALFDYGYLIEVTKEVGRTYHTMTGRAGQPNLAMNLDGYPWVARALAASGDDPEMEFAAALMVLGRNDLETHREHAQKALEGGRGDALLARNLDAFFAGTRGDTMTALLAKSAKGGQ
jgi:hypothetical protein